MVSRQGDFGDDERKSLEWKEELGEGYLKAQCVISLITASINYRQRCLFVTSRRERRPSDVTYQERLLLFILFYIKRTLVYIFDGVKAGIQWNSFILFDRWEK